MIYSLSGTILEAGPGEVVVECAGVGYLVGVPHTAAAQLPAPGGTTTLYTCMNVSENDVALYGFVTRAEREMFLLLTGVSGVGPKAALSILSVMDPGQVALTVSAGDHKAFTAAVGVGPKLGQRLVLELKDKVTKGMGPGGLSLQDVAATTAPAAGAAQQAVAALVSLGYSQSQAAAAIAPIDPTLPVGEIIKLALRGMAGP